MFDRSVALLAQTTLRGAATHLGSALGFPRSGSLLSVESVFTYAADGTTCKVYIQTSFDGGTTWVDVAQHAFTTSTASKLSAVNRGIAPASQAATPTDGTLADNTILQGLLGDLLRVKVITTGTYSGTTHVAVHAVFN